MIRQSTLFLRSSERLMKNLGGRSINSAPIVNNRETTFLITYFISILFIGNVVVRKIIDIKRKRLHPVTESDYLLVLNVNILREYYDSW